MTVICPCGAAFDNGISYNGGRGRSDRPRRFCSMHCKRAADVTRSTERRRAALPALIAACVERQCSSCGLAFDGALTYAGRPRVYGGNVRRFCSLKCAKAKGEEEKGHARRTLLRSRYGITPDDFDALLESQDGVCAICGSAETTVHTSTGARWSMNVDHDHVTGEVRGLLCTPCNRGIGFLRDDPILLLKAADYLVGVKERITS